MTRYGARIGLFSVTIHQALFIAPCSHAFHYKCIRPLLETHHPAFSCPLCRTFADLEEDVEVEVDPELDANSIAETSALSAVAIAATAVGDRPSTGDASSRERDRDVGAETEVEPDTGASRLGSALRSRRAPPVPSSASNNHLNGDDLAENVDAEMEDVMVLPPLPESNSVLAMDFLDGDRMVDVREDSASPVPVPGPARASPGGYSEGDVEVESGGSDGSGHAGDASLHGTRKR